MKKIRIIILFSSCMVAATAINAQKCYRPKPMTSEQIATVRGTWKGNYEYNGKQYAMTVKLYTDNKITCEIDKPLVDGKETGEQIRFCDGGEFHFKKMIADRSYEFQGTPKDGRIAGILTVRKNDEKVGSNGRFALVRE